MRDPSVVINPEQAKKEAAVILSVDLQAAGEDQIKKLDVLLKHLEQNTISKEEFIEKLTAKPLEKQAA